MHGCSQEGSHNGKLHNVLELQGRRENIFLRSPLALIGLNLGGQPGESLPQRVMVGSALAVGAWKRRAASRRREELDSTDSGLEMEPGTAAGSDAWGI